MLKGYISIYIYKYVHTVLRHKFLKFIYFYLYIFIYLFLCADGTGLLLVRFHAFGSCYGSVAILNLVKCARVLLYRRGRIRACLFFDIPHLSLPVVFFFNPCRIFCLEVQEPCCYIGFAKRPSGTSVQCVADVRCTPVQE